MTTAPSTLESWYGVRNLYLHAFIDEVGLPIDAERIVVFQTSNEDEAIALAEAEAGQYAAENGCSALKYLMCFHIAAASLGSAVEVFSLMRGSALGTSKYLDRHFDTRI